MTLNADADAARILNAMAEDRLYLAVIKAVIINDDQALDALTGAAIKMPDSLNQIIVNNRIRSELANALAALRLFDADPAVRLRSAEELSVARSTGACAGLRRALAQEKNIKALLTVPMPKRILAMLT